MLTAKLNCAGQLCNQRDACRRFQVRVSDGRISVNDIAQKTYAWASFDIDHQRFGGSCPSFIHNRVVS